jgi:hypothetical protein
VSLAFRPSFLHAFIPSFISAFLHSFLQYQGANAYPESSLGVKSRSNIIPARERVHTFSKTT